MLPIAGFCKHAVWIFGVLVGLAIKEAITRIAPHLLSYETEPSADMWPEALRLTVFGLMIVRHYLGAAHLFDNVHAEALKAVSESDGSLSVSERARLRIAGKQFGVDFFAGLLHFTLFSVWSLTLELHHLDPANTGRLVSEWAFRAVLLFILTYDVFWIIPRPRPHPRELKLWTVINASTAVVGALWFWWLWRSRNWTSIDAEIPPLLLVGLISIVDIAQLTMGTEFFSKVIVFIARLVVETLRKLATWIAKLAEGLSAPKHDVKQP